tara:strand:- start:1478 stop:1888 length:411 start_codon:yes stop_codon:yes gene_type:complete
MNTGYCRYNKDLEIYFQINFLFHKDEQFSNLEKNSNTQNKYLKTPQLNRKLIYLEQLLYNDNLVQTIKHFNGTKLTENIVIQLTEAKQNLEWMETQNLSESELVSNNQTTDSEMVINSEEVTSNPAAKKRRFGNLN